MKKRKEKVLAYGEVTGHAHRITQDVYEDGETCVFDGATEITHEEHKPVTLPDKKWRSGIVQEYDYFQEMQRQVAD